MRFLVLSLVLAVLAGAALAGPDVTVYSRDLAFVREARGLDVRAATDTVRLENVSTRLDATSVRLVPESGRVRRLAYRYDVASGDGLLERAVGQRVRVLAKDNRVTEGTLLASDGIWVLVRTDDGALVNVARTAVEGVQFAKPSGALFLRPAIEAVIEGARGRVGAELSYLTGGLSWSAEHTLVRTGEKTGTWATVVQVENGTGRDYVDARVKLIAGDVNRAGMPMPAPKFSAMRAVTADAMGGAEDMSEAAFADYHLYALKGATTLRDRETQTLVMLDPRPVQLVPRYVYSSGDGRGVRSELQVVNSAAAGPGAPLPAGRVRVFQRDDDGALQFTGEANIPHVAVDEKATVPTGYAFDLAAERRVTQEGRPSDRERQYAVEIKLRNRKPTPVTIVVEESVGGDTQVLNESLPSTRKDAGTLQWTVPVAAGKEVVLTFSARQRY